MSDDVMRTIAYELSNGAGETITIREERHQIESYSHIYPTDTIHPLVRQSDALSKLAEKDAEIARYREALSKISSVIKDKKYTETYSALKFCETEAQEALKGPEA